MALKGPATARPPPPRCKRIKGTPPTGGTCQGLIEVPPPSWAHTAEMPVPPHGAPNWCLQVPAAAKHWNLGQGQRETWDPSSPGWPGQSFGQMSQWLPEDPPTESRLSYAIGWESLIDMGQGRGGGGRAGREEAVRDPERRNPPSVRLFSLQKVPPVRLKAHVDNRPRGTPQAGRGSWEGPFQSHTTLQHPTAQGHQAAPGSKPELARLEKTSREQQAPPGDSR